MQVIWESRAENDLAEYQEYIHQFNPKASIDVLERIFDCVDTIVKQPLMGKPGKIDGTREFCHTRSAPDADLQCAGSQPDYCDLASSPQKTLKNKTDQ